MGFDITSFLGGGLLVLIIIVIGILILLSLVLGKFKDKIKFVLGKLFTRTSLMLIAIFDVVAAFEPTQVLGGIPLAAITAVAVFLSEWGLHEKWNLKKIILCLVLALVGGSIVLVPTPIAGLFVAWFGTVGDKKRK
jgi:hypothetical protein